MFYEGEAKQMERIWYREPASRWEEALPLGNGRLGAMVFGRTGWERIQLNEDSMWYGGRVDRNNPDAAEYLPKIRKLLFDGNIPEAERLMKYAFSGTPQSQHPYQSLGDLYLSFFHLPGEVRDYVRELVLDDAVARVTFVSGGVSYMREMFASHADDCLIIHLTADRPASISFDALLTRERFYDGVGKTKEDGIRLFGNLGKGGFDFELQLCAKAVGGTVCVIGEHLIVEDADEVTLYFSAGTTYRMKDVENEVARVLAGARRYSYTELKARHIADYRSLYARMELQLVPPEVKAARDALPTDERMKEIASGAEDIALMQTYFQYGRYLLISSSREGTLPATLQGIWNQSMSPAWDSKYTININTEMNYWPAESCNLSECHMPLFDLIKRMVPNGRETARRMYDCRGFVAHHNTDIWGDTAVQDIWNPASYWVMGAAWLCTHQWKHYLYTKDRAFLDECFPIMREAAQFFLDYLVEDGGYLKTCPSVSPENTYILPSGIHGANGIAVTMDNQILRDLFEQCTLAAEELGVCDELYEQIKDARTRLIPNRIGKHGQIMEWQEDYDEAEPGHRHISQLYGLFPSDQISVDRTPELAAAARTTIERRLSNGGGHTGWSRAWIINFYAKLHDGATAYDHLQKLLEKSTLPNLFDNHPPFQIDGNFGATAAIANMLAESSAERTILLPALPKQWAEGRVSGLCLVGGAELAMEWKNQRLSSFEIKAKRTWQGRLAYEDMVWELALCEGESTGISLP